MGGKSRRRKRNEAKRFPYIEVQGIQNRYLDAALIRVLSERNLPASLSDELKLLKKAEITVAEIRSDAYCQEELIARVAPHLLENYDYYNFLAKGWDEIQRHFLQKTLEEEDYSAFTLEEWDQKIRQLVDEEEIPVYGAINFLRFYKSGQFKELIPSLLAEKDYVIQFYNETGIQIEEADIDWHEVEADLEQDILGAFDMDDTFLQGEQLEEKSLEELLRTAARIILNVSEQVPDINEAETYKKMYELEKEKSDNFGVKVDSLSQENKSKESQIQALMKENRDLAKSVESLTGRVESQQKENGRLGGLLGKTRKEKDEVEKTNILLEKRVTSLSTQVDLEEEKTRKELKKEFDKEQLKMKDKYEEALKDLEGQLEFIRKQLEEEQNEKSRLAAEFEKVRRELETSNNDLKIVEKERNELVEQLQQANQLQGEKREEPDDDIFFGFDEEEIGFFVGFDNKPTRN